MHVSRGWFADRVYFGDYQAVMQEATADRLLTFTDDEKVMLKGSADYFGIIYYSSCYIAAGCETLERYKGDRGARRKVGKYRCAGAIVPAGFGGLLS